jgi:predicted DNA-binding protein YlxM (UPF0122 family)
MDEDMRPPLDGFNETTFKSYDEFGRVRVGVQTFCYSKLDSVQDNIRERIDNNQEFDDILEKLASEAWSAGIVEWACKFIVFIYSWKKPLLALDQLAWIFGLSAREGASISELAAKHGISKQAFQQGAKRIIDQLEIPRTSHLRTDEAKANMRKAYTKR